MGRFNTTAQEMDDFTSVKVTVAGATAERDTLAKRVQVECEIRFTSEVPGRIIGDSDNFALNMPQTRNEVDYDNYPGLDGAPADGTFNGMSEHQVFQSLCKKIRDYTVAQSPYSVVND